MRPLVFLAGPISGVTYRDAADWREYVTDRLPEPLVGFSALRGKPHLDVAERRIEQTYEDHPLTRACGLIARDFNDVSRCSLLFVNVVGATQVSLGTVMEVGWAYSQRRPILLVMEPKSNPHDHFMVRESANFIVHDLDEAIALVPSIIMP